jgi:hypothetical protein
MTPISNEGGLFMPVHSLRFKIALLICLVLASPLTISAVEVIDSQQAAKQHFEAGKIQAILGKPELAIEEYLLAKELSPQVPLELSFYLALAYQSIQQYDNAQMALAQFQREAPPDHPLQPQAKEMASQLNQQAGTSTIAGQWRTDPHNMRCIYSPTALDAETGKSNATAYNLGYWIFNHAASANLEYGFHTVVPLGILVAAPAVRMMQETSPGVHVGFYGMLGGLTFMGGDGGVLFFNGGPVVTIGDDHFYVNSYTSIVGAYADGDGGMAITPNIGMSYRVSRRAKFQMEAYIPFSTEEGFLGAGVVLYGFRIFGDGIYGDINFALPICEDCGEIYSVIPFGIPLLAFGFQW